jgi:hypothetical protein
LKAAEAICRKLEQGTNEHGAIREIVVQLRHFAKSEDAARHQSGDPGGCP